MPRETQKETVVARRGFIGEDMQAYGVGDDYTGSVNFCRELVFRKKAVHRDTDEAKNLKRAAEAKRKAAAKAS